MAVNIHLNIVSPKVPGESTVSGHEDQIQLLSWAWGMTQSGTTHVGKGGTAGKVSVQDLTVEKYIDASSSELLKLCCLGTCVEEAVLTMDKQSGSDTPVEYVKLALKNCVVSSIQSGGRHDGEFMTERVTLNFAGFEYTYTPQEATHGAGTPGEFKFSVAQNKAV